MSDGHENCIECMEKMNFKKRFDELPILDDEKYNRFAAKICETARVLEQRGMSFSEEKFSPLDIFLFAQYGLLVARQEAETEPWTLNRDGGNDDEDEDDPKPSPVHREAGADNSPNLVSQLREFLKRVPEISERIRRLESLQRQPKPVVL